ncbi:calcyclin-binding protein-like [Watersipora subatra]|uniref:calcyclin-binding protein-like n=1 Tax=Watersipora subatra TaxID=2589382 RepID=UPI00355BDCF0
MEILKDKEELESLLKLANRVEVRRLLQGRIDEIQKSIEQSQKAEPSTPADAAPSVSSTTQSPPVKRPLKKITSYAWDQSDAFVKVYATNLVGVNALSATDVTCEFHSAGFNLLVNNLAGKDHQLQIVSLYGHIIPEESKIKIKSDSVLVMLKKAKKEKWEGMTEIDRKKKEKQKSEATPKADEDPSAGIMNLMKKMYDEGDDDMKRTIAKAWTESQDKKASGEGLAPM